MPAENVYNKWYSLFLCTILGNSQDILLAEPLLGSPQKPLKKGA
ncbi:hypothetical protein SAMN00768000_1519 [Sulfobacillus thermosulfidooxidans DSM 9293]|uniref:Uncharacterized protein n=1 Tax=Sulfobacillus thermosulfidooxidans (strain DSM 9293 / VKM B-1269 / AT-1) TaxID=929705 RepID=A0A1W1WDD9_SULTA|nr:hypothetical protein SAMN00768000_1519 [Sulfobacillus thermosulfidooxidans DSM 9293]